MTNFCTVQVNRNVLSMRPVLIENIFGSVTLAPANNSVVISISLSALILTSSLDSNFSCITADIRRIRRDMTSGSLICLWIGLLP